MGFFTRKGDNGYTELAGRKIAKCDRLITAEGDIDELTSLIGFAATLCSSKTKKILAGVQNKLFITAAELAGADKKISQADADFLEISINSLGISVPSHFVIPGGTPTAALLHVCRAVCRRAERSIIEAKTGSETLKKFINRLSSLLFALALYENKTKKVKETKPEY